MIAFDVRRIELLDLFEKFLRLLKIIEDFSVFPGQAIHRLDRQQLHIIGQFPTGEGKDFLKAGRVRDHRGATVEEELTLLINIGAAAELIPRLDQRRGKAHGLEPAGKREAAKPRADHTSGGFGAVIGGLKARGCLVHADCFAHASISFLRGFGANALIARRIGTGGLPMRIRKRSPDVDCPA